MGKKTKKTILVIGGTGFIGFHLLKKTKRLNWESYSISRNRPKPKRHVKGVKYLFMNINTANSLLFVTAGLTPFIVYLGLGPDGAGILDQARAEQFFAYLFFSLPIAILMTRRIEKNYFIDGGLIIIVASMSMSMAADAFRAAANLSDVANAIAVTAYSSTILGVSISGIGFFRTTIFPNWLSGLLILE